MTKRSLAREVAFQLLCQYDVNPSVDAKHVDDFMREKLRREESYSFSRKLYEGVLANREKIDHLISEAAENWRLSRMLIVDRNILRLGGYELMCTPETPPAVVVNEAIELAKRFGSDDSYSFINGVLDKINKTISE